MHLLYFWGPHPPVQSRECEDEVKVREGGVVVQADMLVIKVM